MARTAVVLDLDGTLWHSYPLYGEALEQERGIPRAQTIDALGAGENIVRLIEANSLSRPRFGAVCAALATEEILYPGILSALDRLTERRTAIGVVTSLPRMIAGPILDALNLSDYFVEIVFAARKPRPDGIHTVLHAATVDATLACYYVGDQDHDAEAARRAGISFAWASYGYGNEEPPYMTVRVDYARAIGEL